VVEEMTHDELVEKVARVMRAVDTEDNFEDIECRTRYEGLAKEAIAAMREVLESDLTLKAAMNLELIGCWCQGPQRDQFHNFCDYHQGFESGVDLTIKAAGMVAE
jgi:gamma-glutamyl:cysteine ligase YbdK (ATP-grasp superfamily)